MAVVVSAVRVGVRRGWKDSCRTRRLEGRGMVDELMKLAAEVLS
jgi:hypothetical protein